jgi:flavin reductase (DIM6/NTAB) family NADH-FMN oxidoreductase RutF
MTNKVMTNAIFQDSFKDAMSSWPSGVAIVVAQSRGLLYGTTVASFSSLSLTPPMILVCIDSHGKILEPVRESGRFSVSILAESQEHVSRHFARPNREPTADLEGYAAPEIEGHIRGISGAVAWLDCRLESMVRAGDHIIFTGEVTAVRHDESSLPLIYFRRGYKWPVEPASIG